MRIGVQGGQGLEAPTHRLKSIPKSGEALELLVGAQDTRQALVQIAGEAESVLVAARAPCLATQSMDNYRNKQHFPSTQDKS